MQEISVSACLLWLLSHLARSFIVPRNHGKILGSMLSHNKVPKRFLVFYIFIHVVLEQTFTDFKESSINWSYVERLLPKETIPPMPMNCGILPSGWRSPMDPPPELPYFIGRNRKHQPALFLERRRDQLNTDTMDFEYVELVSVNEISGDVFACEKDLKEFLEKELGHPVATYIDEIKGKIKVKGAHRSLLEKFIFEKGF